MSSRQRPMNIRRRRQHTQTSDTEKHWALVQRTERRGVRECLFRSHTLPCPVVHSHSHYRSKV